MYFLRNISNIGCYIVVILTIRQTDSMEADKTLSTFDEFFSVG